MANGVATITNMVKLEAADYTIIAHGVRHRACGVQRTAYARG